MGSNRSLDAIIQPKRNSGPKGATAALLSAVVLCTSCTANNEEPKGVSGEESCGSSLSPKAVKQLEETTGNTRFAKNDNSLTKAVKQWKKSDSMSFSKFTICLIESYDHSNKLIVEFARHDEGRLDDYSFENPGFQYPLGVFARSSHNSSLIITKCPSTFTPESGSYISGVIDWTSGKSKIGPKRTGAALMEILNSVARTITKDLNCLSEAGLPKTLPEGEKSDEITDVKKAIKENTGQS